MFSCYFFNALSIWVPFFNAKGMVHNYLRRIQNIFFSIVPGVHVCSDQIQLNMAIKTLMVTPLRPDFRGLTSYMYLTYANSTCRWGRHTLYTM